MHLSTVEALAIGAIIGLLLGLLAGLAIRPIRDAFKYDWHCLVCGSGGAPDREEVISGICNECDANNDLKAVKEVRKIALKKAGVK